MMLTERFADFIYRTTFEDLPGDIVSLAKERILDSVGAILATGSAAIRSLLRAKRRGWGPRLQQVGFWGSQKNRLRTPWASRGLMPPASWRPQ